MLVSFLQAAKAYRMLQGNVSIYGAGRFSLERESSEWIVGAGKGYWRRRKQ